MATTKRQKARQSATVPAHDPEQERLARAEYEALHGVPPARIDAVEIQLPKRLVALGPVTDACYLKKIRSDLPEHAHLPEHKRPMISPKYCHQYGERWGHRTGDLSDILAHDENGRLWVIPRGNTTVTDRGIEDLPAPNGSAIVARKGSGQSARSNPTQRGVVLTEIDVRTPSLFTIWLMGVLIGLFGVALMPLLQLLLAQHTRLSPADRASAVLAGGVVGGILSRRHPRFSTALTLGGVAAAIPLFVEALQLSYAARAPGVPVDVLPPQAPSNGAAQGIDPKG